MPDHKQMMSRSWLGAQHYFERKRSMSSRFHICRLACLFLLGVLLAACGPSAEEVATMTAAAWTDTPTATATATNTPTPAATPTPTITPTATLTPPPTLVGGGGGRIAFISGDIVYERDVYIINVDGTERTRLTYSTGVSNYSWSPDGSRIFFNDGQQDGYVINADGSGLIKTEGVSSASWSPDGTYIIFHWQSWHEEISSWYMDIWAWYPDSSERVRLTDSPADDWFRGWSPDGTKLLYSTKNDGDYQMNPDGSDKEPIQEDTPQPQEATSQPQEGPRGLRSPDGKRGAYIDQVEDGTWWLFVTDGSTELRLAGNVYHYGVVRWLQNGTRLLLYQPQGYFLNAYTIDVPADLSTTDPMPALKPFFDCGGYSCRIENILPSPDEAYLLYLVTDPAYGTTDLFVVDDETGAVTRLTDVAQEDNYPVWSPDGTMIAFLSERDGNPEIYVIGVDGSNLTRLTFGNYEEEQIQWQP